MNRIALGMMCIVWAGPVGAGITGATADGAWDCEALASETRAAVIVADTSYALITDMDIATGRGTVAGYGTLHQIGEAEYDLPHFVLVSGPLKDRMGAVGLALIGPRANPHDLSGELFVAVVMADGTMPYCRRRALPAT